MFVFFSPFSPTEAGNCCVIDIEELYEDNIDGYEIILLKTGTISAQSPLPECVASVFQTSQVDGARGLLRTWMHLSLSNDSLLQPVIYVEFNTNSLRKQKVNLEFDGEVIFSKRVKNRDNEQYYLEGIQKLKKLKEAFENKLTFVVSLPRFGQKAQLPTPNYHAVVESLKSCEKVRAQIQGDA